MSFGLQSRAGPTSYTGPDLPPVPCVNQPRAPNTQDVYYPLFTLWRNNSTNPILPDQLGDCWILVRFTGVNPYQAVWQKITTGGSGPLLNIQVDTGITPVLPNGAGTIQITGNQIANGATGGQVIRTDGTLANEITIEIQRSTAAAVSTIGDNGVSHFNSAEFTVDANGFVSLAGGGGPAIEGVVVDAHTAPGTPTVMPNGAGDIIVTGNQVAAGTINPNVIRTDSLAANTYTVEIQRSQAVAVTTIGVNGVSHFKSTQFNVDANGFVTLVGGAGPATTGLAMDTGTPVVVPNGAGNIVITGAQIAAGTTANVIRSDGTGANTATIEIQRSRADAVSTVADNGVSHFDNHSFAVDGNGFVTLLNGVTKVAFSAYKSATTTNVTGNGTSAFIICDTEDFDINNNYNNATGVFTAPQDGIYRFTGRFMMTSLGAAHTIGNIALVYTNVGAVTTSYGNDLNPGAIRDNANNATMEVNALVQMQATETVRLLIVVDGSTQTVGVFGSAGAGRTDYTYFAGELCA